MQQKVQAMSKGSNFKKIPQLHNFEGSPRQPVRLQPFQFINPAADNHQFQRNSKRVMPCELRHGITDVNILYAWLHT